MALTVNSLQKESSKKASAEKQKAGDVFASKVDRLAELEKLLAPFAVLMDEQRKLVEELRGVASEKPGSEEVVFSGKVKSAVFGKAANLTVVPETSKIKKALGEKTFMEIAKVTISDLKKYLSGKQQEELLKTENFKGSRRFELRDKV
jgi:hypothetical protein